MNAGRVSKKRHQVTLFGSGLAGILPLPRVLARQRLVCLLVLSLVFSSPSLADGYDRGTGSEAPRAERDSGSTSRPADVSSANYGKDKHYLPGEEVVTPTGQRLKVWSTKGPVPVSQAPQPFEDREKSVLGNVPVVVDVDARQRGSRK